MDAMSNTRVIRDLGCTKYQRPVVTAGTALALAIRPPNYLILQSFL